MRSANPSLGRRLAALVFVLTLAPLAPAQVVIDVSGSEVVRRPPTAPQPPTPPAAAPRPKPRRQPVPQPVAAVVTEPSWWDFVSGNNLATWGTSRRLSAFESLPMVSPPPPANVVLDSFDAGSATGSVRPNTSWVGQVTQNSTSITIGGTATNVNGWGASSLNFDATGMVYLNVTAQRDPGNAAPSFKLQLEDRASSTNTHVVSIDTSLFAIGTPTFVQVPLGTFASEFQVGSIGSWSIGGGEVGTLDFRMTVHNMELTATAIPEPSTVATILGLAVLGYTAYHRRRSRFERPRR